MPSIFIVGIFAAVFAIGAVAVFRAGFALVETVAVFLQTVGFLAIATFFGAF